MSDELIDNLRKLDTAATPLPWKVVERRCDVGVLEHFVEFSNDEDSTVLCEENAKFIAAVRNALPGLLDRLAAAERERDEARAKIADLEQQAAIDTDELFARRHVFVENEQLRAALAEREAIVDKLPKTADGVPIAPGMVVYWTSAGKSLDGVPVYSVSDSDAQFIVDGEAFDVPIEWTFSTRAAALSSAPQSATRGGERVD